MAAKRKRKRKPDGPMKPGESHEDKLADLLELAQKLRLPDGAFNGDLEEACEMAMELQLETIRDAVLLEQLEFLSFHGFDLGRLKQLIEEYAETGGNP